MLPPVDIQNFRPASCSRESRRFRERRGVTGDTGPSVFDKKAWPIFEHKYAGHPLLLCKQAAKNFHAICEKETALKRVLTNLLSAVSFAQI